MDELRNPFAPGAGTPPPELAGRHAILQMASTVLARAELGRPAKSFMLVGLRGVGKTVLLVRIQSMAQERQFKVIMVEATEEKSLPALIVPALRQMLLSLSRGRGLSSLTSRALRTLKSFVRSIQLEYDGFKFGVDVEAEPGVADSGDIEHDFPDLMLAVGRAAKENNTVAIFLIDELQYLNQKDFSALIMAIHKTNQQELPVVMIGAGLPQLVGNAGRSKSYAERLFDFPVVGPLSETEALTAIMEPIAKEEERILRPAAERIAEESQRYPYFLQVWGFQAWNHAPKSPIRPQHIEEIQETVQKSLDSSFFRVRFDRLTPSERRYLRAMAELGEGPHRSGDIAKKLVVKVSSVAPVRNNLIRKGMIYSPGHGDTAFTVPMFDAFMKRQIPTFE